LTINVIVVVALPPELVAVIVWNWIDSTDTGVPEIVPFAALIDNPVGSAGEIDQVVTVPPLLDGVTEVISESLVNDKKLGLYVTEDGAKSMTSIVTAAVSVPPLLDAVIVYSVDSETALGVPLISPLDGLNNSPEGSAGEIDQVATGPPVEVGLIGDDMEEPINSVD
jgi:hypothetical protein